MTARAEFTDEEWFRIRAAPWQAAMGVIEAEPSGTIQGGREVRAIEHELRSVRESGSEHELIHLVAAALDPDAEDPDTGTPPEDRPGDADTLSDRFLEAIRQLGPVLEAKVSPPEADAYRRWLLHLARTAAEAGREGVAGFAGRAVSRAEAAYLERLQQVLGLT